MAQTKFEFKTPTKVFNKGFNKELTLGAGTHFLAQGWQVGSLGVISPTLISPSS